MQTITGCYCGSAAVLPGIHNIAYTAKCREGKHIELKGLYSAKAG